MVKYITFSDREYRYRNRCIIKKTKELENTIVKVSQEYCNLHDYYLYILNKSENIKKSYDFLYNHYSHLFELNRNNVDTINDLQYKYDKLLDGYKNLEDQYTETLIKEEN
tara:strand:- start:285 stop:614 length:330 start_codon:yes stop_codon:yes gene_type:complete